MNPSPLKLIAGILLLPPALFLTYLIFQAQEITPQNEKLSVIAELAQALAILVAGGWAVYTWTAQAQEAERRRRLERVEALHREFLDQGTNKKRGELARFWGRWIRFPERLRRRSFPQCGTSVEDMISGVSASLGIEISVPEAKELAQDQELVEETEALCNRFEYLGKLVEVGAVTAEDVRLFFYTMIGDTFLLVLPYVLFRRLSKPRYAEKFQGLLKIVPAISDDPVRI